MLRSRLCSSLQKYVRWKQHDLVPFVIADSELDMQGIEPGLLGWQTSALTTELKQVRLNFDVI
jgi:hypothetical protein